MTNLNNKKKYTIGILDPVDITSDSVFGGSTGFIKSILPYLTSENVVILGQGINGTKPWKPVCLSANSKFIPISHIKLSSKIPLRLKALYAYTRNRKKILELGLDVLYIHSPEICLPFLVFNKKIPVIYHQHGSANPCEYSKFSYGKARIFQKFFDVLQWFIHKKSDWIVAIDDICLEQANQNGVENKVSLLLNAVNTSQFKPDEKSRQDMRNRFGIAKTDCAILYAGRMEQNKGFQHLLKCVPLLKSEGIRFHIFLAGDGTYKSNLQDIVKSNGCEESVAFLGQVPHNELPHYYNMADVLVLASDMEGMPMVILEALACGTPVVANRVGGIPLILQEGINGILTQDRSRETIASSIIKAFLSNYDRLEVARSVENLGSTNAIAVLEEIFTRSVINKKALRSR